MNFLDLIYISKSVLLALAIKKRTPLIVSWHITYRCNLRCRYCGFWENSMEELDTQSVFKIIDQLASSGTKFIIFTGGEPLLRQDLSEIIEYCKLKDIYVSINSNGVLIKEQFHKIKQVDSIKLSLDGSMEINDSVRGFGAYDKVIEALRICKDNGIDTSITTVISSSNVSYIMQILEIAKKYQVGVYFKPADKNNCGNNKNDILSEVPDINKYKKAIRLLIESKAKGNDLIKNSIRGLEYLYSSRAKKNLLFNELDFMLY